MAPRAAPSCRFAVSTRVMRNLGKWQEATVIALNYREDHWPLGKVVPYQVSLTNFDDSAEPGEYCVPADTNAYVRSFDERRHQSGLHINFKELLDFLCHTTQFSNPRGVLPLGRVASICATRGDSLYR